MDGCPTSEELPLRPKGPLSCQSLSVPERFRWAWTSPWKKFGLQHWKTVQKSFSFLPLPHLEVQASSVVWQLPLGTLRKNVGVWPPDEV